MVQTILQTTNKSRISNVIVSENLVKPSVRCWGGRTLTSDSACFVIKYTVDNDGNGSKFRRILYIPIYLSKKNLYSEDDYCFYEDHCIGGPHFDTQGGQYPADDNIRKILLYIKLKQ